MKAFAFACLLVPVTWEAAAREPVSTCRIEGRRAVCQAPMLLPRTPDIPLDPGERAIACACDGLEVLVLTDRTLWTLPLRPDHQGDPGDDIQITLVGSKIDLSDLVMEGVAGAAFSTGCVYVAVRPASLLRVCPDEPERFAFWDLKEGFERMDLVFQRGLLLGLQDGRRLWALDMDRKPEQGVVRLLLPPDHTPTVLRETDEGLRLEGPKGAFSVLVGAEGIEAISLVQVKPGQE